VSDPRRQELPLLYTVSMQFNVQLIEIGGRFIFSLFPCALQLRVPSLLYHRFPSTSGTYADSLEPSQRTGMHQDQSP